MTLLKAADLNDAVARGRAAELVAEAEAKHVRAFEELARTIAGRDPLPRLVMIAGPSSAGKTTSCRRLSAQLGALGLRQVQISTDDYFVPECEDPVGPDGKPDYEDIRAVDVASLRADMAELLRGGHVRRRTFDFAAHLPSYPGDFLELGPRDTVMLEGIHALNPALSEGIPRDLTFRIYLAARPRAELPDGSAVPPEDVRLVRRIVRDSFFRSRRAGETLAMWPSVRRGEEKWISPWRPGADAEFDSALDYELSALRPFAEPLLEEVGPSHPCRAEARRLLATLRNFTPMPATSVPGDSILREYIGGSALQY